MSIASIQAFLYDVSQDIERERREHMVTQDRPERRINRRLMWMGHYSIYVLLVTLVLDIAAAATGQNWGPVGDLAGVAGGVWIVAFLSSFYHDAKLCERCVAASPLDPQAAVDRWILMLRWEHLQLWKTISLLGSGTWLAFLGRYNHVPPWWYWIPGTVLVPLFISVFVSSRQHRRLYPWCPFCHWGDGGDEEAVPDVPAPTVSA